VHSLPCSWKRRDAPKGQRDSVERAYPVFLNMRCSAATPSPRERTCRTSTPRSSRTSQSAQAATRLSGRRHYGPEIIRTLSVVDTAQRAGLALGEIRLVLEATPGDRAATERLRQVAERKLPALEAMIDRAELVRGWLEHAADCKCPFLDDCPLFDEPTELPPRRTF
jgi:DNA-binding transcriptional MerR regulator